MTVINALIKHAHKLPRILYKRANIFNMADRSRHKSLDMFRKYVPEEDLFADHSAEELLKPTSVKQAEKT